jgi:molecular chaperone DnaK (HSP70)
MGLVLGLDIGAHAARAAYLAPDGAPRLVRDAYGQAHIPSVVRYTLGGVDAGYYAERFLVADWENSLRGCARFIGRYARLPAAVLADATCAVREREGRAYFNLLYGEAYPEELYARLVAHLVAGATTALAAEYPPGATITDVVLTVPASADDEYRVRVREAVEALGLRVRRLLNQPTAALLAARDALPDGLIAVADVGGGKTDISIARKDGARVTVLATRGDPHLGGHDFARRVAELLDERFARGSGRPRLGDTRGEPHSRVGWLGLLRASEEAIEQLTTAWVVYVVLDHGAGFGQDLMTTLSRRTLNEWIAPLVARLKVLAGEALHAARVQPHELAAVLLTGGATQIPTVRRALANAFRRKPSDVLAPAPLALVAFGAAVQGGLLTGDLAGQVWDVTPYPLGIRAYDDDHELTLSTIIPANTAIPTAPLTQPYRTTQRDQRDVTLAVLQCRRGIAGRKIYPDDCEALGEWSFDGLTPAHGEYAHFDVTFAIDADGILTLDAQEHGRRNRLRTQVARWG